MSDLDTENSWNFFMKTSNNKKFNKSKWMDQYCVRKIKKKYHAWKRFTHSHSYRDYEEHCKL